MSNVALPTGAADRKNIPIVRGLLDYFPAALAAVAELSRIGNEQHNPGEEMHWARGKSSDHADCAVRHIMDRGTIDTDKVRHSTKAAWRALANLQEELEKDGAPLARGARAPKENTFQIVSPPEGGWVCACGSTTPGLENKLCEINDPTDKTIVCANPECFKQMTWVAR